jgi:uncharacterized linocin/CFP29 family protein
MSNLNAGAAQIDTPRSFFAGGSGRWAGERWMKALKEGRPISPAELRTLDILRHEEWIEFDTQLVLGAQDRLRAVQDVINAGLVKTITNGMAKTVLEYDTMGDLEGAIVSLDGITRSENDRLEFEHRQLPLPITHKDIWLNLRHVMASRLGSEALDTTYIRIAGRKIAEKTEDMLINGGPTYGGLPIYGYTTHPDRLTSDFGSSEDWSEAGKTGDEILVDVQTMIAAMEGIGRYGPFVIYLGGTAASLKLSNDYKAATSGTIRQRLLELEQISDIRVLDRLATNHVLMVELSADVVQMISGEPLQTVQWDLHGGFEITFKAFQIMVPLVRSDADDNLAVYHMYTP